LRELFHSPCRVSDETTPRAALRDESRERDGGVSDMFQDRGNVTPL
jgi:hypothetical protein